MRAMQRILQAIRVTYAPPAGDFAHGRTATVHRLVRMKNVGFTRSGYTAVHIETNTETMLDAGCARRHRASRGVVQ